MEFGPQAITIGAIQIRYYGIIIVSAILIAAIVAARLAKRDGRDPDHVWGAMFGAVILGIIGARLWYILFPPASLTAGCADGSAATICRDTLWYFQNFFNLENGAIAIWSGGLHIFGAFLGGGLGAWLYLWRSKLRVGPWLDIAAVALPLGQFVGRWANYVNQELYGTPTGVNWWGIPIESAYRVAPFRSLVEYPSDTLFHPLFLYEGLWSLGAFFVLLWLWDRYRTRMVPGTIFLIYIAQYAFIRFMLEFIRVERALIDVPGIGGVNTSQVVAGIAFVVAVALLYPRLSRFGQPQERRDPDPVRPQGKAQVGSGV
jgi:phosphatidylglycerol---prolipoprotein diacylglyceryl transferase